IPHRPPRAALFPYTTLFRSKEVRPPRRRARAAFRQGAPVDPGPQRGERLPTARLLRRRTATRGRTRWSSPREPPRRGSTGRETRSEEHTSELQSLTKLVCRL